MAYIDAHGGGQQRRFTQTHWATDSRSLEWETDIFLRRGHAFATRYVSCQLSANGRVAAIDSSWQWHWRL